MSAYRGPLVTLGVDPGSKQTGIVVRRGADLLDHVTISRQADERARATVGLPASYLGSLRAAVAGLIDTHPVAVIAIEGVVRPNPHVNAGRTRASNIIDPTPIIATAVVLGYLWALHPDAVIVPPGRNGSQPLLAYPRALVSKEETRLGMHRVGGGKLRHARSAWDVAGSGALTARVQASKQA